jgi:hypothetical protein
LPSLSWSVFVVFTNVYISTVHRPSFVFLST